MQFFLRRLAGALLAAAALSAAAADVDRSGGPYVPTPQTVVDAMLKAAEVGAADHVIDLGSGDGRIVLTAATRYKASGTGVEIDDELVARATESAKKQGVADRARFVRQDVRQADLGRATVVTLYLLPGMMAALQSKLLAELKPGTRIVSHDFTFDRWQPDRTVVVDTPEKYDLSGSWSSDVHVWVVPAAVQGAWNVRREDEAGASSRLEVRQAFQRFSGQIGRGVAAFELHDGQVNGREVSFAVAAAGGGREVYTGAVAGDRIEGEVRNGGTRVARWSATRMP